MEDNIISRFAGQKFRIYDLSVVIGIIVDTNAVFALKSLKGGLRNVICPIVNIEDLFFLS